MHILNIFLFSWDAISSAQSTMSRKGEFNRSTTTTACSKCIFVRARTVSSHAGKFQGQGWVITTENNINKKQPYISTGHSQDTEFVHVVDAQRATVKLQLLMQHHPPPFCGCPWKNAADTRDATKQWDNKPTPPSLSVKKPANLWPFFFACWKRFIYLTSSSRDIKQSVCFIQQCSLLPACGERVGCMMVKLLILSNVFFSTQNRDPLPLGRQWREQATHLLVLLSAPSRSPCLGVGWRWPYMQRAVHITIGAVFFLLFFYFLVRAGYRSSACGRFKRAVCSFGCGAAVAAAANGLHFADDDIITLPLARQIWRSHCVQFFGSFFQHLFLHIFSIKHTKAKCLQMCILCACTYSTRNKKMVILFGPVY